MIASSNIKIIIKLPILYLTHTQVNREIAILAGTVMDTLNTVGATYLKNGPKPKTTTQKNNDHDKPPYYPPPTALFLSIYTPAASDRWHDG